MPAETAHVPSPYHESRRPVLQRQTSITQTIRRYCIALVILQDGTKACAGGRERHQTGPLLGIGVGNGAGAPFISGHSYIWVSILPWPPILGPDCSHFTLLFVSPHSNTLAPHSRQVHFGQVHTLPLPGPRAARRASPQRQSLSWSLLRYHRQVMSVLVFFSVCMSCVLLELP